LRTHTRLATLRRFTSADSATVALLGPGPHVAAGNVGVGALPGDRHDYRSFGAHFVEVVYSLNAKSDLSLGFGVDPWILYPVTNEYADIGWDFFLFERGASPGDAARDPVGLGRRIEDAERALERERRLSLEARVRF